MFKNAVKVLVADVVLLVAEFYVLQDLQWRSNFATLPKMVCPQSCSYTPSFSYGVLTQLFTMAGKGVSLTSPATLDWTQLIVVLLVLLNSWFVYGIIASRRGQSAGKGQAQS